MYFWSGITALALLGIWGHPSSAQVGEHKHVEEILTTAATIQQNLFEKFQLDGVSTTNCLINGIKSRNVDILQLKRLVDYVTTKPDIKCNSLAHEWKYDFQDFFERDSTHFENREQEILSSTCGRYPSAVVTAVSNGQTPLTEKIILGLLATVQPNITTPDAITLLENSIKIIETAQVDAFYVEDNNDVLLAISNQAMSQNDLNPHENYQLYQMSAAQTTIQRIADFNILSIIRRKTFPQDVITARDAIAKGIDDGQLELCLDGGWSTPPDQLLALVTSLTAVSNDHQLASSVHVVYSHVRMWYYCLHGYQYIPRTFNDIVFLLNSFLTIRNPTLLLEVYNEFSQIPWQEYSADLDFKQYCDPRSLMIAIVQSVLDYPDILKTCNTILLNYFINADADSPSWLKPIFPANHTGNKPLEIIPTKEDCLPPIITTEAPPPKIIQCQEGETKVVNPESLIAIFDSNKHPVIAEILRQHQYNFDSIPYHTREAVFKFIIHDLLETGKESEMKQRALHFAAQDLLLNEVRTLPVEWECSHLVETNPCGEEESTVIDPECLIEIFDSSFYSPLEKFLRDHPFSSDATDRYDALVAILKKYTDDERVSEDLQPIFAQFLGTNPPINRKANLPVTWTCVPKCNLVSVIDQASLIGIINEGKITPIKNVIYQEPVFLNDYTGLETREAILKKVLADRKLKLKDDVLQMIISQAIIRMKISWQGMLPPIVDELCEHDLKYNIHFEPEVEFSPTCDNLTVINQQSIMDIIAGEKVNVLKNLVFMEPVLDTDYGHLPTREEILKGVLLDRMAKVNDEILTLVVTHALERLQVNWRGVLPPLTEDVCKDALVYNIVTPVPPIDDDIICEESAPEEPDCGQDQNVVLITDTSSLFAAFENAAPRATAIRKKLRESVYPIDKSKVNLKGYVLRDILLNLREEVDNQRLLYEVDELLVSIKYSDQGLTPVGMKYICVDKIRDCSDGEKLMNVIDVTTLWDAVQERTTIPLNIMERVETYLVPANKSKSYQKSVVLREILNDLLKDTDDVEARESINQLTDAIRDDGPGFEDAKQVLKCFPDVTILQTPCDDETKTQSEVEDHQNSCEESGEDSSEMITSVLPLEIQNQELEVTTSQPQVEDYATEETESWEEFVYSDEVADTTTETGENPKRSDLGDAPDPTTEIPVEESEECEDSEEVTSPQPLPTTTTQTETPVEEYEELTTPHPTMTTPTESTVEECEDSEEVTMPLPVIEETPEPTTPETIDGEELEEAPTSIEVDVKEHPLDYEEFIEMMGPPRTEEIPQDSEECDEIEDIMTTTEATTTEPPSTPALPNFDKDEPCKIDQWPLLLKVNLEETCFDKTSMSQTHPVDVVSVGELLSGAEGTDDEKYIISAKLAGLDTYDSLRTFDWEAYCTKSEFFDALMEHIGFKTNVEQCSSETVTIRTICRKSLTDAVPSTDRHKRHVAEYKSPRENIMNRAMKIAQSLVTN